MLTKTNILCDNAEKIKGKIVIKLSFFEEYQKLKDIIESLEKSNDLYFVLEKQLELGFVLNLVQDGMKVCTRKINQFREI